jgi:hypothetical protein
MGPTFSQMILSDIARLRKMPDLAKRIAEFQPQPDPMAQKKAELELALLEAQVVNETAKGEENRIDSELKKAKIASEMSKAKLNKSKADMEDLSFIEKESGADQQKNLELQRSKIEGDILKERSKYLNQAAGASSE